MRNSKTRGSKKKKKKNEKKKKMWDFIKDPFPVFKNNPI
jgi:hypothetical protein